MTSLSTSVSPVYSLGGPGAAGWPAVPGTSIIAGNPIEIVNSISNPCMVIICIGGTATVFLEGNGSLPVGGIPISSDWIDVTGGSGYAMTSGQTIGKLLPLIMPYWRCRISAIAGATVNAYVPAIQLTGGFLGSASYPTLMAQQALS